MLRTRIAVFFNFFYVARTVAATVYNRDKIFLVSQKKALKMASTQTAVVVSFKSSVLTNGVFYGVVPNN